MSRSSQVVAADRLDQVLATEIVVVWEAQAVAQRLRGLKAENQQTTERIGRQMSNAQVRPRF